MRKNPHFLTGEEKEYPGRKRKLWWLILLLALLVPLAYEYSKICIARWRALYGQAQTVSTPLLDALDNLVNTLSAYAHRSVSEILLDVPWRPGLIIPLAFGWAFAASLLLRKH